MLLEPFPLLSADIYFPSSAGSSGQSYVVPKPGFNNIAYPLEALSLHTIAGYACGSLRASDPARLVTGISTDSRTATSDELFLALRGDSFDGHAFIRSLARRGVPGAVIMPPYETDGLLESFALLEVDDTLLAYHRIAAAYRRTLPMKVIAITGSNGKTSTKDFTAAALGSHCRVLKTEGNFNNHIGVPRMLLRASKEDQIAVLEMGMNHPGEIAPLAAMAAPQVAIITNIGTAHIEYMKTREAIAQEKGVLAEAIGPDGHVILNAEDDYTPSIAARTRARVVTVGLERGDLRAENFEQSVEGSRFDVVAGGERLRAHLPVAGRHMVVNALLALGAAVACGRSLSESVAGLGAAKLTRGRLELKIIGGLRVLDDSYNANPDSVVAALQTLARVPVMGRRIAVLGRMGELGEHSVAGHARVGEAVAREGIDYLIGVGSEARTIVDAAREAGVLHLHFAETVEEAATLLKQNASAGDTVLVKGSRSAAMERVIAALGADTESTTTAKSILPTAP